MDPRFTCGRIVVISPHLDDAVMSLGALIAAATRRGARVTIATVFAGRPDSMAASGPWDRKSKFVTEGEGSRRRRAEDREACALLGAEPHWLDFGDEQYPRGGDARAVLAALRPLALGASVLLMPGFPLRNADHAWLTRALLSAAWPSTSLALYAEQPYTFTARRHLPAPDAAGALDGLLERPAQWSRLACPPEFRRLKQRAIRCYRSQLRQLGLSGLGLWLLLRHETRLGGEAVAWLD